VRNGVLRAVWLGSEQGELGAWGARQNGTGELGKRRWRARSTAAYRPHALREAPWTAARQRRFGLETRAFEQFQERWLTLWACFD